MVVNGIFSSTLGPCSERKSRAFGFRDSAPASCQREEGSDARQSGLLLRIAIIGMYKANDMISAFCILVICFKSLNSNPEVKRKRLEASGKRPQDVDPQKLLHHVFKVPSNSLTDFVENQGHRRRHHQG